MSVTPFGQDRSMPPYAFGPALAGRGLRYFACLALKDAAPQPLTIADFLRRADSAGLAIAGRPSKTLSDALRWEVTRGRIVRTSKARYALGRLPDTSERRMRGALARRAIGATSWI